MSYGEYLKALLEPMGVYRLEGTLNGGELDSIGAALDGVDGDLEHTQREVAGVLGISRSYVSRIEKGALFKLRNEISPCI